jgi:hypothetical protein
MIVGSTQHDGRYDAISAGLVEISNETPLEHVPNGQSSIGADQRHVRRHIDFTRNREARRRNVTEMSIREHSAAPRKQRKIAGRHQCASPQHSLTSHEQGFRSDREPCGRRGRAHARHPGGLRGQCNAIEVLRPGDVLLSEDTSGTGHKWRLTDDQPWRRAYVVEAGCQGLLRAKAWLECIPVHRINRQLYAAAYNPNGWEHCVCQCSVVNDRRYGAIGAAIGHEISHGFDIRGAQFDGDGNLKDWWSTHDHELFVAKAEMRGEQYNAYSPQRQ